MEIVLNFIWFGVTSLLLAGVIHARRQGQLRLSVALTLGCVALLALVLFPAISMTDDLAQVPIYGEGPGYASASSLLQALEDGHHLLWSVGLFACGILCALLRLLALPGAVVPPETLKRRRVCDGFLRVCAMRPPPSAA